MIKFCLLLLISLTVFATLALATQDLDLKTCKHQCKQQREIGEKQREQCERQCEELTREKKETGSEEWNPRRDPEREYRQCRERCQEHEQGRREQQQCQSRCDDRREEQRREREESPRRRGHREWEGEEEEEGQEEHNPYVFEDQHFTKQYETEHGSIRVLQKFTQRSKLFKGIENFRVVVFQANPQTFVVPNHWDADSVFFVARGRGTVTLVFPDGKKSFNIERGHVMTVPAGVSVYMINRDNDEQLILAKLVHPVSTPGSFEPFFGAGGRNPESFFNAFSTEILEAAFKTSRDNIQKIFSEQREGAIIKASKEQIRAMSQQHEETEEPKIWPFGGRGSSKTSHGPINILHQRPTESNKFGKLFEIDSDDFKQLQDTNVAVTFANLTRGAMIAPHYNTRATKIAVVVDGEGYFEMACPHVSGSTSQQGRQRQQQRRERQRGRSSRRGEEGSPVQYEKISGELRCGTVFVVPAGHPFVTIASRQQNLEIVCFEINADNNRKFTLAGKNNIMKNFEREAKELAFGVSADEVDQVLESQDEEFFFAGPKRQQHEGRADV